MGAILCCCKKNVELEISLEQKNILKKMQLKDVDQFSFKGLKVFAKVVSVYDGDTIRACFYYKNEIVQTSCRLLGFDSPEIKISKNTINRDIFKTAGIISRDRLQDLINSTDDGLVKLDIEKNDLYGRALVNVYIIKNEKEINVNKIMLLEGLGKPYSGQTKNEWTLEECKNIIERHENNK